MEVDGKCGSDLAERMRLRIIFLALLCALALSCVVLPVSSQSLQESWVDVQQGLSEPTTEDLDLRIRGLEETAEGLRVLRMTGFASAMVSWAQNDAEINGEVALTGAQKFDPKLPSSFFLRARWDWEKSSYFSAMGSYLAGLWALIRYEGSQRVILASALICGLFALALSLALVVLVQTSMLLRRLVHDAFEFGGLLFQKGNAVVFAVVISLLPLFAGFGPTWLFAYLFAMVWVYLNLPTRIFGIAALGILAIIPIGLEVWQSHALRQTPVTERVVRMLEERQIDFSTLREFSELENDLSDDSRYFVVLGELLRMHGHPERARTCFQTAAVVGSREVDASIFLGSQSMEDGDIHRAIQYYDQAVADDARNVLAYVNLSTAYDLSNRFVEGDAARNKALEVADRRLEGIGLVGLDPRIRFPRLGRENVEQIVRDFSPEMRRSVGLHPPNTKALKALLTPFSMAMWVNIILGSAVLAVRSKMMWVSNACSRCGKVFCPKCKTSTESMSYCSQCISVFLKRDLVSIDQQTAKMKEIRRWEMMSMVSRRITGVLIPGSHLVLSGRIVAGFSITFATTLLAVAAFVWLPLFFPAAEPLASILPMQIVIVSSLVMLWVQSSIAAWFRR